ncbi:MAG TPA: response regulator transcription factor [Methanocella sp.]|uniref:response regulator n=1 Tax=Methanocella sp. TaxID=2052833 RepID=UPI002CD971CD|nr:response regulator transcription factor [Methanocella sp.]HTY91019.1 response regulator transcription factor [Methanocella sp.]
MLKVAIVDDEPDLQRLYKLALASRGYDVAFIANDGTDAVEKNLAGPADIIIMDHRMPTKNGIEATREILSEFPNTGIIFVSADEAVEKEAKEAGAKRFLKKPISLKDLIKNIEDVAQELGIQSALAD